MPRDLQYILTTVPGLALTAVCPWIGWEYRQHVFYQPCAPPQGPRFLTGQGRYSTSDLLHWSALVLQQCKPKKSRNYLLDLLRVNICLVCSFPEKEKSHDPVTMNTVKGRQGLGFKSVCIPCLLILLISFFFQKQTYYSTVFLHDLSLEILFIPEDTR